MRWIVRYSGERLARRLRVWAMRYPGLLVAIQRRIDAELAADPDAYLGGMIVPTTSETRPPAVSRKWLAILISATKSTTENTRSAIPAALASRVPNAKRARMIAMTPMMPGKIRLGFESSKMMP